MTRRPNVPESQQRQRSSCNVLGIKNVWDTQLFFRQALLYKQGLLTVLFSGYFISPVEILLLYHYLKAFFLKFVMDIGLAAECCLFLLPVPSCPVGPSFFFFPDYVKKKKKRSFYLKWLLKSSKACVNPSQCCAGSSLQGSRAPVRNPDEFLHLIMLSSIKSTTLSENSNKCTKISNNLVMLPVK